MSKHNRGKTTMQQNTQNKPVELQPVVVAEITLPETTGELQLTEGTEGSEGLLVQVHEEGNLLVEGTLDLIQQRLQVGEAHDEPMIEVDGDSLLESGEETLIVVQPANGESQELNVTVEPARGETSAVLQFDESPLMPAPTLSPFIQTVTALSKAVMPGVPVSAAICGEFHNHMHSLLSRAFLTTSVEESAKDIFDFAMFVKEHADKLFSPAYCFRYLDSAPMSKEFRMEYAALITLFTTYAEYGVRMENIGWTEFSSQLRPEFAEIYLSRLSAALNLN